MTVNIFTQYEVNGSVNSGGKVFIGAYGQDPTQNPIDVYTDVNLTNAVSGFGIDLDFNGLPIVNGQRVNLYVNESYSIQIKDEDSADLFIDWVNVQNPVDEVTTQNWLKDLVSLTPNVVLTNDGNGNWEIDASALGGGDVFLAGTNNFTGTNSFQGEVGVWNYVIDTNTYNVPDGGQQTIEAQLNGAGWYELEFWCCPRTSGTGSVGGNINNKNGDSLTFYGQGFNLTDDSSIGLRATDNFLGNQSNRLEASSVNTDPITGGFMCRYEALINLQDPSAIIEGIFDAGIGVTAQVFGLTIRFRKIPTANITLI